MSDLPNFAKKSWFRRTAFLRLVFVLISGAMVAALAWGEPANFQNDVEMTLRIINSSSRAEANEPVNFSLNIKNNGDQTVKLSDMQVGVYLTQGSCLEAGKAGRKSFSLPQNISVGPNSAESVNGHIEVLTPCDGKAASEIFAVMQRDTLRIPVKRPGPVFDLL